jgi:hypothetical protein
MAQLRVYEPQDTPSEEVLQKYGFRWCKKDCRWEKTIGLSRQLTPEEQVKKLKENPYFKNLKMEIHVKE